MRSHALAVAAQLTANQDRVVVASRDDAASSWSATTVGDVSGAAPESLDTKAFVDLLKASDFVVPVIDPRDPSFRSLVRGLATTARM